MDEVRSCFLSYFEQNSHRIVPSGPIVPEGSSTLIFTSAGMVQFMDNFVMAEKGIIGRVASAQRCIRAGGKHNDFEDVGYTPSHHTFFEMLGNFSFGDYFKEESINYAWDLITRGFGLHPDRLLVTVHEKDEESAGLWKKISGHRIVPSYEKENFWSIDETSPCGPCSEIFYDYGEKIDGIRGNLTQRFVEIWNLVFMQYKQVSKDKIGKQTQITHTKESNVERYIPLIRPSVDTGMGLERMVAVLQDVYSNYETTHFKNIIKAIVDVTGVKEEGYKLASFRIIADHLRSSCFLIAEGVLPSNEGRGYVLRRIIRRSMCHTHLLDYGSPLLYQLVPVLILEMGNNHPHLKKNQTSIREILRLEEESFQENFKRGMQMLRREIDQTQGQVLPGKIVFKLHDTYGFPAELTQDILRAEGKQADLDGFKNQMERQRETSRISSRKQSPWNTHLKELDQLDSVVFLGEKVHESHAVIKLVILDGLPTSQIDKGEDGYIILDQSPFYAESGGQIGDTGWITGSDNSILSVDFTNKLGAYILHHGRLKEGSLRIGQSVTAKIDKARRLLIQANHSATHLLHAALKRFLGPSIVQLGSLIMPGYLRFDFNHPCRVVLDQLDLIEESVNRVIRKNEKVSVQTMPLEESLNLVGSTSFPGGLYPENTRVVSIGSVEGTNSPYSVELCCGTHVQRTGDIGYFRICKELSLASGVRRIEAKTGFSAETYTRGREILLVQVSDELETDQKNFLTRLRLFKKELNLLKEYKQKEQAYKIDNFVKILSSNSNSTLKTLRTGVRVLTKTLSGVSPSELRLLVDGLKSKIVSGIVLMLSINEDRAILIVGVTSDLTGKYNAIDLVKKGAKYLGGKGGGGRPDLAQSGGPLNFCSQKALETIELALEQDFIED